jgi:hypothetical protein
MRVKLLHYFIYIRNLSKDAGYNLIVHTDSVEPETDLTGEVLQG